MQQHHVPTDRQMEKGNVGRRHSEVLFNLYKGGNPAFHER